MTNWATGTFGTFRNKNFRTLWIGSFFAFAAFFMSLAVQGVVAFELTGQNRSVGIVIAAQGISQGLLGPLGGALADRFAKKLVVLICQALIAVVFGALTALVIADMITILLLSLGSFVIGAAFSFLGPARNAWVVELVEKGRSGNAIALTQIALNASRILGPVFAAVVLGVAALGTGGAYAAMSLFYVTAVVMTLSLPMTRPESTGSRASVLADIADGVRVVLGHRTLRFLIPSYLLVIMTGFGYITVLPGLVNNELGRDPRDITTVLAVAAVGGLLASVLVAAIADSRFAFRVYWLSGICFGASLALSAAAPAFPLLVIGMFFVGLTSGGFQTLCTAIVSNLAPPQYLGRVLSLTFLGFAASNLFSFPFGVLADVAGERIALGGAGVAIATIAISFALASVIGRQPAAQQSPS